MTVGLLSFVTLDPWTNLDGRLNAPSGTPQFPTLLNGYPTTSPPNARTRWPSNGTQPPWMVAGVDYAVGPPSDQTFIDPSISPPANCTFAGHTLTVNADDVTIDGYDFTLFNSGAGCLLACTHDNLVVTNCKFNGAGTQLIGGGTYIINFSGSGLTFTNCVVDGSASDANGTEAQIGQSSLLVLSGTNAGNVTLRYNWFLNYCQHIVEIINSLGDLHYQFNLIDDTTVAFGAHMNWLQWSNSLTTTCDLGVLTFNTSRQLSLGGAEGFQWGPSSTSSVDISNNTFIAKGASSGTVMSYPIHVNDDTPASGGGAVTNATSANNYADITGADGLYHDKPVAWTFFSNVNMSTGGTL